MALLVNQRLHATNVFRTVFFLPHLTPVVASIYVWTWLLNPSFGLMNEIIYRVSHLQGPGWFGDTTWAIPSLVLVALWGAIGVSDRRVSRCFVLPRHLHCSTIFQGFPVSPHPDR